MGESKQVLTLKRNAIIAAIVFLGVALNVSSRIYGLWVPLIGDQVQVPVGEILDYQEAPTQFLSQALWQNPFATRFTVTWNYQVLSAQGQATAIYDRRSNTLTYDHRGSAMDTPEFRDSLIFHGVTDSTIHATARRKYLLQQIDKFCDEFYAGDGCTREVIRNDSKL